MEIFSYMAAKAMGGELLIRSSVRKVIVMQHLSVMSDRLSQLQKLVDKKLERLQKHILCKLHADVFEKCPVRDVQNGKIFPERTGYVFYGFQAWKKYSYMEPAVFVQYHICPNHKNIKVCNERSSERVGQYIDFLVFVLYLYRVLLYNLIRFQSTPLKSTKALIF